MEDAETVDLLDLELSHEDDVSKPVSGDEPLFYDDPTQQLLGNNIDSSGKMSSRNDSNKESTNINIGSNNLNDTPSGTQLASTAKCWNIEYYQPYFDIDTSDELQRLKKALFPFAGGEFLDKELNEKPDLYGPFWITTTLAFLMAAMGNFAAYINTTDETVGEWSGDITRISEAATFLYTGSSIVPILMYIVLRTYDENKGLVELVSLYGYSLMPFIASCILCIAPWNLFDW
eukprot:CAMPEP_0197021728 /NCGR_PEP_ID=MMETSP1384-20130603/2675_1 /TAXON_ID=29189 /ORGANISM="Ammonia sp." /LENGTH=231 /DNA_ID=CAMNT_0042449631 /DNA_START=90 /DNA_END=782 /DNA_ORIENTATION=+